MQSTKFIKVVFYISNMWIFSNFNWVLRKNWMTEKLEINNEMATEMMYYKTI